MANMVGLNVTLKMGWMKKAVELLGQDLSEAEYKSLLREHLSFEIDSPTNLRKATDNLTYIWYKDSNQYAALQQEGRRLVQKKPEFITAIGWCMIPMAYPLFHDLAKLMGKMFGFQDTITTAQIRQKMYDEWGERNTLEYSVGKVLAAMKSFDAVSTPKNGNYQVCSFIVKNEEIVSFMLRVAMKLDGSSYYSFDALKEFPFLFPFKYEVTREQLMNDEHFSLSTFGANLSVTLK